MGGGLHNEGLTHHQCCPTTGHNKSNAKQAANKSAYYYCHMQARLQTTGPDPHSNKSKLCWLFPGPLSTYEPPESFRDLGLPPHLQYIPPPPPHHMANTLTPRDLPRLRFHRYSTPPIHSIHTWQQRAGPACTLLSAVPPQGMQMRLTGMRFSSDALKRDGG